MFFSNTHYVFRKATFYSNVLKLLTFNGDLGNKQKAGNRLLKRIDRRHAFDSTTIYKSYLRKQVASISTRRLVGFHKISTLGAFAYVTLLLLIIIFIIGIFIINVLIIAIRFVNVIIIDRTFFTRVVWIACIWRMTAEWWRFRESNLNKSNTS